MKWQNFVDHISTLGYEGDGDDFGKVSLWLKDNGHDTERLVTSDGDIFQLKELFDQRPGRPMDVTAAVKKADEQEERETWFRSELEKLQASGQFPRPSQEPKRNPHKHIVTGVRDRREEDPRGGFKSMGHFCKDVILAGNKEGEGLVTDELTWWQKASLSTYANETAGADGGFAVPPEFREAIMVFVEGEDSILSRTDQQVLSSNNITFPTDETTPWGTAGIQAAWEGEAGSYAQTKPVLTAKELKLRKCTVLVPLTEELMEDASAMSGYVTRKAGEVLDFKIGEAIFRGTGAGQPFGFMNSSSLISVAKEGSQVADTITGINVLKMWSRMYAPYRRDAVWYIQQDVEPQLNRMSLQARTDAGSGVNAGQAIYLPGGNVAGTPFATLMGRPVIPTQHCETVGDLGDIVLASMSQYVTAVRSGGVEASSSIHLWFDQDAVALKFRMRMDGQPWRNTTISPRDGSNTMSAFVTLAVRA